MDPAAVALHGLVQRGARKQQRELRNATTRPTDPRRLARDGSLYAQLWEEGWGWDGGLGVAAAGAAPGRGGSKRPARDEVEEAEETQEDEDSLSSAGSTFSQGSRRKAAAAMADNVSKEERRHCRRRHYLCPQGAWPVVPAFAASERQEEERQGPPPSDTLPDDLPIDGVRHYVPRVRERGLGGRDGSTLLEWLPVDDVVLRGADATASTDSSYPVPSPVVARLLDAAIVRQLAGRVGGDENDKQEKGGEVRLHDLLQAAMSGSQLDLEEEMEEEEEEEGQQRPPTPAKPARLLKQCLGREVERMVDSLLGHVLATWAERVQAHCSDEGYRELLQQRHGVAAEQKETRAILEDLQAVGNLSMTLGDWHDVLSCVESKAAAEQTAPKKGRRAKPKGRQTKKQLEEAAASAPLRPAVAPETLQRARARLEALFLADKRRGADTEL